MYHALSLALTGSESISYLLKVVVAHALLKFRATMISAFHDAFPGASDQQHNTTFNTCLAKALRIGAWGSDYHLFALSLLLNRPIFHYNTFYDPMRNHGDLCLRNVTDVHEFAQKFKDYHVETRGQLLYCSSVHRALGTINTLLHLQYSMCIIYTGCACYHCLHLFLFICQFQFLYQGLWLTRIRRIHELRCWARQSQWTRSNIYFPYAQCKKMEKCLAYNTCMHIV